MYEENFLQLLIDGFCSNFFATLFTLWLHIYTYTL